MMTPDHELYRHISQRTIASGRKQASVLPLQLSSSEWSAAIVKVQKSMIVPRGDFS